MNKSQVETKEDLELYYSKVRKFKFEDDVEIKSIEDIYENINKDSNNSLKTIYKKGNLQCEDNKRRSVNDFFILCKTYFPEITIKELTNFLINKNTYLSFCPNIKKDNIYHHFSKPVYANLQYRELNSQSFKNCKLKFKDIIE